MMMTTMMLVTWLSGYNLLVKLKKKLYKFESNFMHYLDKILESHNKKHIKNTILKPLQCLCKKLYYKSSPLY